MAEADREEKMALEPVKLSSLRCATSYLLKLFNSVGPRMDISSPTTSSPKQEAVQEKIVS